MWVCQNFTHFCPFKKKLHPTMFCTLVVPVQLCWLQNSHSISTGRGRGSDSCCETQQCGKMPLKEAHPAVCSDLRTTIKM